MKAFEIQEFGIDKLAFVDREDPAAPASGEVLVRLTAASLNYRDLMIVKGVYNPKLKRPLIPLSDAAGVVEKIGPGVSRFKEGDRVAGCFFPEWPDGPPAPEKVRPALGGSIDGVLRQRMLFRQDGLVRVPSSLSDEQAATLPCAGLTAWHALFEHLDSRPGETVLIQGTGGVSIFALQFAHAAGMRTIVTSSSDEKLQRAKQLGANETINYKTSPDWDEAARKLIPEGVGHVIEVGGSDTMPRSLRALRMHGTVSVIGVLSGVEPAVGPRDLLINSLRIQGIYVGSRAMFERMNEAIELHRIRPVVDRMFPWTEFKQALRYMEGQQHFGKICLKIE
ncbi:MAG: NAD(P)-dependent alcohol dehydrogenase [Acidobacteriaceae bacterium]|nr:NAD(P)-dependent alcohol dehydrogenase [Acidobacteriaceae bacterium]MBV8571319.1 NAD(P)-dependent alcohol dehydrogenase [Acidobacteriaceae bacterium]